jgi:hypothetical protein
VSRYPFDQYTLQLDLGAFAVDSATFESCDANATSANFQNAVSFQVGVGQGLQGFSATFQLEENPEDPDNPSSFSLVFNVKRGGVLKFFAVVTFISESRAFELNILFSTFVQ